jgi:hypothetical protein
LHLLSEFVASGDILMLTTRSDEAIIYWFFEEYLESDWLKAIMEDLVEQSKPTTYEPPAKRTKRLGCQHASRTLVHSYYRWRQKIAEMGCDKNGVRLISLHRILIVRWRFKEAFKASLDVITLHAFQSLQ